MKRFLKKRWLGIPVGIVSVVLVLVLLGGSVLALTGWYTVLTGTADVTVDEAITIANAAGDGGQEFTGTGPYTWTVSMYPGEMKALYISVSNASSANLAVVATVDPISAYGLTVTGTGGIALAESVVIPGGASGVFSIEVTANGNIAPGTYTINFALHRAGEGVTYP